MGASVPEVSPEQTGTVRSAPQLTRSGCGDDFSAVDLDRSTQRGQPRRCSYTLTHTCLLLISTREGCVCMCVLSLSPQLVKVNFVSLLRFFFHRKRREKECGSSRSLAERLIWLLY